MRYERPATLKEAVAVLAEPGIRVSALAGGTDLIVQMQAGIRRPDCVLDIKAIPGVGDIAVWEDSFRIGAAVSAAQLTGDAAFRRAWPGLTEAVALIGSTQVQSRATPVGNLCNGSPAADAVPALMVACATATILGPAGQRRLPVAEIPVGPGRTALAPQELILWLDLPPRGPRAADAYLRLIPRTEMDIAVAGAAVDLALDAEERCRDARVAIGAVAPTARLVPEAGAALIGSDLGPEAVASAVAAVRAAAAPIDDKRGTVAYRIHTVGVLAARAIAIARRRAEAAA